MLTFHAAELIDFSQQLFVAAGVPAEEATTVSKSLVDANLCGHDSHGVIRVPQYINFIRDQKLFCAAPLEVLKETPAMLTADAHWGLGQVQAYRTLERLLPKAKALGVACGTLRQCGHIGRLGEYAEWAAGHGLAFFTTVNSHGSGQRVAPPGGLQGRISTNPLCIGAPTPTDPLVLDFSTSAVAEGKVRVSFQKGSPIPEGWILDAQGQPTTNPADLYADPPGTILPFGGPQAYKGFGLGFMLDVLAGGLSGGDCTRGDRPMLGKGNTVVFVLWDIEMFGGQAHFMESVAGLVEYVRTTPRVAGVDAIILPGDPERQSRNQRLKTGIPVAEGSWSLLTKLATDLNVTAPAPRGA